MESIMEDLNKFQRFLSTHCIRQKKLSNACGLTESTISLIATGRLNPSKRERVRIMKALGIKDEKLIFD